MREPTAEPELHVPDRPAPLSNSVGPALSDDQPVTRPDPAIAVQVPSTPGPHAPERGTHPDPLAQQLATSADQFPPIPGYDVQRFVGRGGMGIVYRAVHRATGRTVALKLINPSGARDPLTRNRFDREVRTLAALKHPNIVPVYDAGDWHGFPYCAMEFVPGGTLSEHLDRVRADLRGAVRLMVKVARTVAAVHTAGVLHRDLKPLNILLGPNDEPMVADFGLVRWSDDESDLTSTGLPIGTRVYMAPEQTLGRRTDYTPACDIWALGVTLFEVFTGTRPFADDGSSNLYARIRSEEAPRIETRSPTVSAELVAVVQKCLEKRPEDRYATAAAVADDLERWLDGKPVLAPPVPEPTAEPEAPVSPLPSKSSRRSRAFLVVTVAVVLALGAGAVIFRRGATDPGPVTNTKTLAERVAAGEKVKLTDEKGAPTVPLTLAEGHELSEKPTGGYRGFFGPRWNFSIAALADEGWGQPIRVEGDIGMFFSTDGDTKAGFYVGRRMWPGTDPVYESIIYCGITPRFDSKTNKMVLTFSNGVCLWPSAQGAAQDIGLSGEPLPWSADEKAKGLRFTHVVIDVRPNEIRMTGDGVPLKPVIEEYALRRLNLHAQRYPAMRQLTFTAPVFGTGIGVFCQNTECVVANLTVSKLDP
jgi:eukaryotic-like serine/threonine-protein kinase